MTEENGWTGLTQDEVKERQVKFGKNEIAPPKKEGLVRKVIHVLREPMFLLLLVAAVIYFILGEPRDGAIMLVFVLGIVAIDVIQEWKTDKTLRALQELSAPRVTVVREGETQQIESAELVPGDVMLLQEGERIPADGTILRSNDLCVDESTLTGEAEGVWKDVAGGPETEGPWRRDWCYAGTQVLQGSAVVQVDRTGASTEYGKIGLGVAGAPHEDTPLQKQTGRLVKVCAVLAGILFVLVGIVTWCNLPGAPGHQRFIESVLSGVTLAMAMIPEEFPVVLTVFLSMGAWRLAKKNSLVRRLPSVETLGAVSVLCVDKTGTITQNKMSVQETWSPIENTKELAFILGMACETDAYDPMEQAMLDWCDRMGLSKGNLFSGEMVTEYPFTNVQKMMGHVWEREEGLVIAAKGSPERLLSLCGLAQQELHQVMTQVEEMASRGLRVIAVAKGTPAGRQEIPAQLNDCRLALVGLIGLADPPREGIEEEIAACARAGIRVVMITGDNGGTARAIAQRIGIPGSDNVLTGDQLDQMSEEDLRKAVQTVSVFARVVPEHKMRIVKAFRDEGEIVAMTGDGVNDAPALKYAHIGIAMGQRGSEVSRQAADLILLDDNFTTITETVRDGRRIFDNIRRAVGYIFSIHIPIALSSLLAPALGIATDQLFLLPLHVVVLELMIDPTCSVVLERQPGEPDLMDRPPRRTEEKLLSSGLLGRSVLQGLAIFAAAFGAYYFCLRGGGASSAPVARSMGLSVLIFANLLLVQGNSSEILPVWKSVQRLSHDKVMWAASLGTVAMLALILYTPLAGVLKLSPLSLWQLLAVVGLAAVSVLWYEVVKAIRRRRSREKSA